MDRLGAVSAKLSALTGAAAVILSVAGASLGDPYNSGLSPDSTDSADTIAAALVKVQDEARLGVLLGSIGAFLLIWFLGYLKSHLQSFEGPNGWMSSVAFGGGLVAVALLLVSHGVSLAATETAAYGQDPVVAKVFLTLGWNYFFVVSPPLIALVAASSVIGLRFEALPRWLSVLGIVMLIPPFFVGAGLGAVLGLLWLLITSVVFVVTGRGEGSSRRAS